MIYLGIDPGQSGGLAARKVVVGSAYVTSLTKMPATERDIWEWIDQFSHNMEVIAIIEKVHAMPDNGVSGMFKFGMGYGGLKMALCAADIPYEEVSPHTWQKALGITVRQKKNKKGPGETKVAFKQRLRAFAQKLFPKVEVSLATADALLIALYCQRKAEGRL